jgi:hypothetical protein
LEPGIAIAATSVFVALASLAGASRLDFRRLKSGPVWSGLVRYGAAAIIASVTLLVMILNR